MLVADGHGTWAVLFDCNFLHFYSLFAAERVCSVPLENCCALAFHPQAPLLAAATSQSVYLYAYRKTQFVQVHTLKVQCVALSFGMQHLWVAGAKIDAFPVTIVNNELVHIDDDAGKVSKGIQGEQGELFGSPADPVTCIAACARAVAVVARDKVYVWVEENFVKPLDHYGDIVDACWRPCEEELILAVMTSEGLYIWRETPRHEELQFRCEIYIGVQGSSPLWVERESECNWSVHQPSHLFDTPWESRTATIAFTEQDVVRLLQLDVSAGKMLTYSMKEVVLPGVRRLLTVLNGYLSLETTCGDIECWDQSGQKHWALSTQRGHPVRKICGYARGMVVALCGPLVRWFDPPHQGIHIARDGVACGAKTDWMDIAVLSEGAAIALNSEGELFVLQRPPLKATTSFDACRRVADAPSPVRSIALDADRILLTADAALHVGYIPLIEDPIWQPDHELVMATGSTMALHGTSRIQWVPDAGLFVDEHPVATEPGDYVVALAHCGEACAALFHSGFYYLWAVRGDEAPVFRCKERLPRAARKCAGQKDTSSSFRPWNALGPVSSSLFQGSHDESLSLHGGTIQFLRVPGDGLMCACSGDNLNGVCGPVIMVRTRGFCEGWKRVKGWEGEEDITAWCCGDAAFHLANGQKVTFHRWSAELRAELQKSQPLPLYHPDTLHFLAMEQRDVEVRKILSQLQRWFEGVAELPVTSVLDGEDAFDVAKLQEHCHECIPLLDPRDQTKLLAWLPLFAERPAADFDMGAARFLLAWRFITLLDHVPHTADTVGVALSSEDLLWALHARDSDSCVRVVMTSPTWDTFRKSGLGLWCGDGPLKQAIEAIPKRILQTSTDKEKTTEEVALWYALLGRKSLLVALYKQAKKLPLANLLSENLRVEPHRTKVLKNAFHLITQKRYPLACAFFFLAGSYCDACDVCVRYLEDVCLAMVVARFADDEGDCVKHLCMDEIRPMAEEANDPFLLSLMHWHVKDFAAALDVLRPMCGNPRTHFFGSIRYSMPDSPGLPAVVALVHQQLKWKRIDVSPPCATEPSVDSYIVRRLVVLQPGRDKAIIRSLSELNQVSVRKNKNARAMRHQTSTLFDTPWAQLQLDFDLPFLATWKDHPNAEMARTLRRYGCACLEPLRRVEWRKGPVLLPAPCLFMAMQLVEEPKIQFALAVLLNIYALTPGLDIWLWDAGSTEDGSDGWASACLASVETEPLERRWTAQMLWGHLFTLFMKGPSAPFWTFPEPTVFSPPSRRDSAENEQEAFVSLINRLHHDSTLEMEVSQLFAAFLVHVCCDAVRQVEPAIEAHLPLLTLVDQRAVALMSGTKHAALLVQALRGGDVDSVLSKLRFTDAALPVWRRLNCSHTLEVFLSRHPSQCPPEDSTNTHVLKKLKHTLACMAGDPSQLNVKLWFDASSTDVGILPLIRTGAWDLASETFLGQFDAVQTETHVEPIGWLGVPKAAMVHPTLPIYALVDRKESKVRVFGFRQSNTALCELQFDTPDIMSPRPNQIKHVQWDRTHRLLAWNNKRFCLWSFRHSCQDGQPYFAHTPIEHYKLHAAAFVSPSLIATCGARADTKRDAVRTGVAIWDTVKPSNPLVAYDRVNDDTVYICMLVGPSTQLTLGTQCGSIAVFDFAESVWVRRLHGVHESIMFLFSMGKQMEYVASLSSTATLKVWSAKLQLITERKGLHADTSLLGDEVNRLTHAQKLGDHHILTAGRDAVSLHWVV